ncbi:MAG: glycosyltransferase [Saprospiraceae bacterium]
MAEDISWRKYAGRFRTFPGLVNEPSDREVSMIVCIPACAEPDIISTLDSLFHSHSTDIRAEIIVLFNKNSFMSDAEIIQHQISWEHCEKWISQHVKEGLRFLPIYLNELPDPKGGVGWARKMAMDEAARRLESDGIIVCLDADCTVAENYLNAIVQHFHEFKTHDAVSIFYEHKVDHLDNTHRDAIVLYELHLRYLINAQQCCGHPFAHSTIGSAMAVRRKSYLDQGGMNTRRAGEDFYFLQKFIEIGTHGEIRNTTVYPSARISSRVPFGTGRAMHQILNEGGNWLTTDFQIFRLIKPMFQLLDKLRDISMTEEKAENYLNLQTELNISSKVIVYLQQIDFLEECRSIAEHTASYSTFRRRFFRYFNSFRMIKYMHYMSDHHYPDIPVLEAVDKLAKEMKLNVGSSLHADMYLKLFRHHDRQRR